jgi:hypothetical protein
MLQIKKQWLFKKYGSTYKTEKVSCLRGGNGHWQMMHCCATSSWGCSTSMFVRVFYSHNSIYHANERCGMQMNDLEATHGWLACEQAFIGCKHEGDKVDGRFFAAVCFIYNGRTCLC